MRNLTAVQEKETVVSLVKMASLMHSHTISDSAGRRGRRQLACLVNLYMMIMHALWLILRKQRNNCRQHLTKKLIGHIWK